MKDVQKRKELDIVENVYFIKFIHLLCPSYVVPDRRTLALTTLDETYELIVNQIKNKLKSATSICATTDLWTSTQKLPYIGVTIHFFDDNFKFHNYTINIYLKFKNKISDYIL